jgi:hypothetical protein
MSSFVQPRFTELHSEARDALTLVYAPLCALVNDSHQSNTDGDAPSIFPPVRAVQLKMRRNPFRIEIPRVAVAKAVKACAQEVTQIHFLQNVFR